MPAADVEKVSSSLDPHMQTLAPIERAIDYTDGRLYREQFDAACKSAREAINKSLADKSQAQNLAIVSDLDETLFDNRPFFQTIKSKNNDQIDWQAFEAWQATAAASPLKETKSLVSYARSKGLAVFLITGRMEKLRRVTIENLVKYGIAYDGLYMRASGDEQSAATMKSGYRKQIEDMGFKIVVNIGDQYSDLAGGHSIDCEKLPNKIYFIR